MLQESNQCILRLLFGHGGCFDLVDKATFAVCAFVPGVHLVELGITLVDHKYRAFGAILQIGAGHDDGNFYDALDLRVQARHLAIEPDQVFIGFA